MNTHLIVGIIVNVERNKVLLFKRAAHKLYQNTWAPVGAGPYGEHEDFRKQVIEEVEAETGLHPKLIDEIPSMPMEIGGNSFTVHPFLFENSGSSPIRLNEEHTEAKWVNISDLDDPQYDARMQQFILRLLKMPNTI